MSTELSDHELKHLTERLYGPEVRADAALWTARVCLPATEQLGERFNEIEARLAALEANAAPSIAPESPVNAPEVPMGPGNGTGANTGLVIVWDAGEPGVSFTRSEVVQVDDAQLSFAELAEAVRIWRKVQACSMVEGP